MISVIVPVYKVEEYLDRCVQSLLAQSYDGEYEIILVDDGSPDNCGQLCDEYAQQHDIIRSVHKSNGGLSSARNYGVEHAKGKWVTFVDSDDYVSETYLYDLMYLIKKFNADMAITNVILQTPEEALQKHQERFKPFSLNAKAAFLETYLNDRVGWSSCGKLILTETVKKHPFPDGFYEEMASTYLFISDSPKVAFGDYRDNYHYLRRPGSITARPIDKRHMRVFQVCKEIGEFIKKNYPEKEYAITLMYEKAVLQLLNRTILTDSQFRKLFCKYRKMFRRDMFVLLKKKDIVWKSKYYAIILSTTPTIYRLQRAVFNLVKGKEE